MLKKKKVGEFVTYGLEYVGQNLTFYRNGVAMGAASAACLTDSKMHVVFSHDMLPPSMVRQLWAALHQPI